MEATSCSKAFGTVRLVKRTEVTPPWKSEKVQAPWRPEVKPVPIPKAKVVPSKAWGVSPAPTPRPTPSMKPARPSSVAKAPSRIAALEAGGGPGPPTGQKLETKEKEPKEKEKAKKPKGCRTRGGKDRRRSDKGKGKAKDRSQTPPRDFSMEVRRRQILRNDDDSEEESTKNGGDKAAGGVPDGEATPPNVRLVANASGCIWDAANCADPNCAVHPRAPEGAPRLRKRANSPTTFLTVKEERNAKIAAERDMVIHLDPAVHEAFTGSTSVSRKFVILKVIQFMLCCLFYLIQCNGARGPTY